MTHVDFWSLDVEGGELEVLRGLDWRTSVHVFLIEGVTQAIRKLLTSRGFDNHPFKSPSRLNEIWVHNNKTTDAAAMPDAAAMKITNADVTQYHV